MMVGRGDLLDSGTATDVGRVRTSNQDALFVVSCDEDHYARFPLGQLPGAGWGPHVVAGVADGMGGHPAGDVASALAVETLVGAARKAPLASARAAADWLKQAVVEANLAVWRASAADPSRSGMGTTLVCALVGADGTAVVANVGDSRAYRITAGEVTQVTLDNSWVADQVRTGRMSERDAEASPYRHVLSRALGTERTVEVDVYGGIQLGPGDWLVLCSDGVSMYLGDSDLLAAVARCASAQEAAETLVREAVARGGADNATVAVVRRPPSPRQAPRLQSGDALNG